MLRIITDFDGPIMDVSERYYQVYQFCLARVKNPNQEVKELSKADFWTLKRARVPETEIGTISGLDLEQARHFAQLRRQTVHTMPYLSYDRIQPGAREILTKIREMDIDLVVMTMRRTRELAEAFERYQLHSFFAADRLYCLNDDYIKSNDVADKSLLMAKALNELPQVADTWMVGDTEADIVAAKTHGLKVIGVLSGIRDREQLLKYQPDHILSNLGEAVELITAVIPAMT
ncbi:HAD family hydrolase [Gloeocapsa sp. PCC 73106]|uniref:HAD family hydrolase n=1 Tax=Gloeocapsa sp. PCC 73106 TaxID=102232 RepID=UPI0002ACAD0B|nr:HAD family hydrolase [Gloeocapsa sp. PCC 73106]ELR96561.1 putative phosphatase [Gloeocapsa sp. PCC 73106]